MAAEDSSLNNEQSAEQQRGLETQGGGGWSAWEGPGCQVQICKFYWETGRNFKQGLHFRKIS